MELDARKLGIFKAIIDEYIMSASPVGSRAISKHEEFNLSSATIRNEMADLEELGYLEQPHTSAGRVPSDKAYRLYVDQMMQRAALTDDEDQAHPRAHERKDRRGRVRHETDGAGALRGDKLYRDGHAADARGKPPSAHSAGSPARRARAGRHRHHDGICQRRDHPRAGGYPHRRAGAHLAALDRAVLRLPDGSHRRADRQRDERRALRAARVSLLRGGSHRAKDGARIAECAAFGRDQYAALPRIQRT